MKNILAKLRLPAIIGSLFVLPLILMEWINNRNNQGSFPFALFAALWVAGVILIFMIASVARRVQDGNSIVANPVSLFLRVAIMVFIASFWTGLLVDQMPCFIGVPNCD